jgi:hypothetical protein
VRACGDHNLFQKSTGGSGVGRKGSIKGPSMGFLALYSYIVHCLTTIVKLSKATLRPLSTMKGTLLPLLLGLLSVRASHQEQAIPQTDISTSPTSPVDLVPRPTAFNHEKRADHIPPNFCGWFSGSGYGAPLSHNCWFFLNLNSLLTYYIACRPKMGIQ